MPDVMKQVIQEVLKGNKTIVSSSSDEQTKRQGNRVRPKSSQNSAPGLSDIKRPNYQQLKKDKRLSGITNEKVNRPNSGQSKDVESQTLSRRIASSSKRVRSSVLPERYNQTSVSRLSSLTLAQGRNSVNNHSTALTSRKRARVIGKVRNGGYVWIFPHVQERLLSQFHRPLNNLSIGVVEMPQCLPSYLLLINDVIRNNQDLKFYISWDRSDNSSFVAELYLAEEKRLEAIMSDLYQKINRRSLKKIEAYTTPSPSSWLSKQLNINTTVDSVAFLEGVPRYNSILLIDNLLQSGVADEFEYEINSTYLLLTGNEHVISKLIAELKRKAEGL